MKAMYRESKVMDGEQIATDSSKGSECQESKKVSYISFTEMHT